MATFDPQAILDAVDAGTAPETWRVYHARKSYLLGQGAILWLSALAMLLATAALAALAFLPSTSSWTDPFRYFVVFIGLVIGAISAVSLWEGFILVRQIRSASKQMLVLTPDGFVVRTGPSQWLPAYSDAAISPALGWAGTRGGRIYSIPYDKVVSVDLYIGNSLFQAHISLFMTFISPIRLVMWLIVPRFPSRDTIAQSIIEAHTRYTAQHAEVQ